MVVLETFPEAQDLTFVGVLISIGVYGHILLISADMIGDGAESLLEAFPKQGALIGGLLIPILGAIPDGMMILLSGLGHGTKEDIQRQLNVGVGTLAGSTIMLLTLPFAISIFMNRRPVKNGRAKVLHESTGEDFDYTQEAKEDFKEFTELTPFSRPYYRITVKDEHQRKEVFELGSQVEEGFSMSAWIMMGSTVTYLLVQVPAFVLPESIVRDWALVSFVVSIALLGIYCYWSANKEGQNDHQVWAEYKRALQRNARLEEKRMMHRLQNFHAFSQVGKSITEVFNSLADGKDGLDEDDVRKAFQSLGLNLGDRSFGDVFCEIDLNKDKTIDLDEFKQFFVTYISEFATSSLSLDHVDEDRDDNGTGVAKLQPDVEGTLASWITKKSDHVLYLKNLNKSERKAVHEWCNEKEKELRKENKGYTLQHYSEPYIDAEDFTKTRRRLRVELCEIKDGKARYDPKLRRWACASGRIQQFCVRTYQNKQFPNFYKECLKLAREASKKSGKGESQDEHLTEDDVVFLSEYWKLPVYIQGETKKKQEAAVREKFKDTLRKFQPDTPGKMIDNTFKLYLESMVASATDSLKPTMHKDFTNEFQRRLVEQAQKKRKEKSINKKTTKIYQGGRLDEKSSLKSTGNTNYGTIDSGDEDQVDEDDSHDISGPVFWMLWGSFLVAVFSDPMVEMIDEISNRIGVNAFYVSFIVTPLVSNASEVVCSARMASKLTNKTLTVALSTLYGAAVMNSTFCMAIFTGLVYFRKLEWNYSAEVVIIVIVMYVLGGIGIFAKNGIFTVTDAIIALSMLPFSLVFVYVCQNYLGMP